MNLCKKLEAHFDPKPAEIVQWFKFHSRIRKLGQSILDLVAALRKLVTNCNFGGRLDKIFVIDRYVE